MHSSKWSESFVKKMFLNFLTIIKIEQITYFQSPICLILTNMAFTTSDKFYIKKKYIKTELSNVTKNIFIFFSNISNNNNVNATKENKNQ